MKTKTMMAAIQDEHLIQLDITAKAKGKKGKEL
jgi:hypothetical protein